MVGTVIGKVWGSKKLPGLESRPLLLVSPQSRSGPPVVAVDCVGAGEGETVLVSSGGAARAAAGDGVPTDAAIVGIVDDRQEG